MLSKNRNVLLLIILVVLVAVYWWSSRSGENQSNYRTILLGFDTATVDQIKVKPPLGTPEFTLDRSQNKWTIHGSGNQYKADAKTVQRTLDLLNGIPVKRVASKNATLHDQFAVTNEKGTQIELFSEGKRVGDLMLGKFDYFQPQNAQPDPRGRQPQGEMVFYASIPGEPTVYVVDGQVGFGIGKDMSAFRNKTIVSVDKANIEEVLLETSGHQTNHLVKRGAQWMYNDELADSASVAQYLGRISQQNGSKFADVLEVSTYPMVNSVKISGNGFDDIVIQSYQQDSVNYFVTSSQNTEAIFLDSGNKLVDRLLEGREFFIKEK